MKDLYGRLNLPPYASTNAIRAALELCRDPQIKADAQAVLLDPKHRAAYDRAHRLLSAVGTLRRRTNLHLRPFWARSGNQDFSRAVWNGPAGSHDVEPKQPHVARWLLIVGSLVLFITIAWLAWKRY